MSRTLSEIDETAPPEFTVNPQTRRRDHTTDSFAEVSVITTMAMGSYGRSGRVPAALVTRAMAAKVSAVAASMACLPGSAST